MPAGRVEPIAQVVDTTVPGPAGSIPVRVHTLAERPLGVVVHLHGGGHVTGTIDSYDGLTRRLANRTPATVVSVGYRRAPEHRCPAAVEDAEAVYSWTLGQVRVLAPDGDGRVAVAGDSAGGNNAAVLARRLRDARTRLPQRAARRPACGVLPARAPARPSQRPLRGARVGTRSLNHSTCSCPRWRRANVDQRTTEGWGGCASHRRRCRHRWAGPGPGPAPRRRPSARLRPRPAVSATGGYRLHLDERACAALRRHLAPAHFQALLASSAGPAAFRQFAITDHRLRLLGLERQDPSAQRLLIGRVPLRRLLAHGLGEALSFGKEFTHHQVHPDGDVTAYFADGSSDRADLLVGADGAGSTVARALAGRATSTPVGISGIAGLTPLDAGTRSVVPDLLHAGPALAFAPGGVGAFLSLHDPTGAPAVDPATCRQVTAEVEPPLLVWGLIASDRLLPADLRDRTAAGLVDLSGDLLAGWSGDVRALVAAAEVSSVASSRFRATDPEADLTPWPAGPVTYLGDAVHAMPPTGGMAAATAIRDADLLAGHLDAVRTGASTLPLAVHDYQRQMAAYAPGAVRRSLAPLRWIHAATRPAARLAARGTFPAAALAARAYRTVTGRDQPVPLA